MENNKLNKKIKSIEYKGIKYNLPFNLNVMEKIQDRYETIDKWSNLLESGNAKAIKFGFTEMINEGIDIENETAEVKKEFLTEKQVGRMISEIGLQETAQELSNAVIESTQSDEKNA